MSAYLSIFVAVIGIVLYFYFSRPSPPASPNDGKFAEIGRIAYGIGLLAFLLTAGNAALSTIGIQGALSLIICIIGVVVYLVARADARIIEIGRIAYAMGGLAFLIAWGSHVVSVLSK